MSCVQITLTHPLLVLSGGGIRRDVLHAKTLLTHANPVTTVTFSRYWARLKPRSESLARSWRVVLWSTCI